MYFTDAICSGSSISWNAPVLVSDQRTASFYIVNIGNYNYYPRLANRSGLAIPAIIWPYDFWHFIYPTFRYDSTYILVDNMIATGVNEAPTTSEVLNFVVTSTSANKIRLQFNNPINEKVTGNLISLEGRILKSFEIPEGSKEYEIKNSDLKSGVYFIQIRGKTLSACKKLIIAR